MKIPKLSFIFLLLFLVNGSFAQKQSVTDPRAYFGLGAGLDYGGLGLKAEFLPLEYIGIFAGGGYNLLEPAFNAGISVRPFPRKKVQPFLVAMYGYNAAIKIQNRRDLSKTYYGFTMGVGCDIRAGLKDNKVSLAVLVPFRSREFHDQYDYYEDVGFEFRPGVIPIAVSIGYNFAIHRK